MVSLRLRGFDRGAQRKVVLSAVHGGHEEERKQTQINPETIDDTTWANLRKQPPPSLETHLQKTLQDAERFTECPSYVAMQSDSVCVCVCHPRMGVLAGECVIPKHTLPSK